MVGQTPYKQKNVSPLVTIVFTRQGNTILDKLLFPWLDFFFLDLRSEGLSSLASLGRQLSFFPTISEKKVQSRKEKFVLNCIPCLVTLCHQAGIYILNCHLKVVGKYLASFPLKKYTYILCFLTLTLTSLGLRIHFDQIAVLTYFKHSKTLSHCCLLYTSPSPRD